LGLPERSSSSDILEADHTSFLILTLEIIYVGYAESYIRFVFPEYKKVDNRILMVKLTRCTDLSNLVLK